MLRSRPNMAAAMESSTSRVSTWTSRVPPADGGDQDAGQRGQRGAEGPRERSQPFGPPAVELEERRVVDDRPHGHPGAGALEEQADAHRDEHAAAEGDRLVIGDVDPEELELRRVAEEQVVGPGHSGVPDPLGQRDQPQHDADGDHDLGDVGGVSQPAHDAAVEDDAQQGRQHRDAR